MTRISFIDSTPIEVCHPCRAKTHKVFGDLPQWGRNSVGWYAASFACKRSSLAEQDDGAFAPYLGEYALRFKLHLIVNDQGE